MSNRHNFIFKLKKINIESYNSVLKGSRFLQEYSLNDYFVQTLNNRNQQFNLNRTAKKFQAISDSNPAHFDQREINAI